MATSTRQPPHPTQASHASAEETDEVIALRQRYGGHKLSTLTSLFENWGEEDLLFALNDANGDLEVAIDRISSGQAEQWGQAKKPKEKKASKPLAPAIPFVGQGARGAFAGRGRGGFEAGRGGRGGARGGRGGRGGLVGVNGAAPRAPHTNGVTPAPSAEVNTNSTTPASFAPTSTPSGVWGKPAAEAAAPTPEATNSETPSNWADETAAAPEASTEAPVAPVESTPAVNGEASESKPVRPAARTIAPGSKISWASIARPASPPKPTPPPPAPVAAAPPPAPAAAAPSPPPAAVEEVAPEPTSAPVAPVEETATPTISLPTSTDQTTSETVAPSSTATYDPWGSTPAAAAPSPAPLAVGEGWADSVIASAPVEQEPSFKSEIASHLPPNDVATAGPIEVSPAVAELAPAVPVVQQQQPSATPAQPQSFGAGPPGLPPKRAQQEAVVLPGSAGPVDRVGLQFGSLDLLDGSKPSFGSVEQQQQQQQQVETPAPAAQDNKSLYSQEAPGQAAYTQQQQQQHAAYEQAQAAQYQQPQQQQHQQQHQQQDQSAFAQAAQQNPNLFPGQSSAFSRYPAMPSPYGQQPQQPQHQQPTSTGEDYSAYGKPAENPVAQVSSPYFQHPGAASHSPAPAAQQQPQQSPYAAFNSVPQQQAPGAPFGSTGATDYSSLYGAGAFGQAQQHDAFRGNSFYDGLYGQQGAPGSGYQAASPLPGQSRPEESAAGTPQQQQAQTPQQQQQAQQAAHNQFYSHPYAAQYNPYQYYGYQQYQQVPPNFNALSAQFPYGYGAPQQAAPQQQQQQYGRPQAQTPGAIGGTNSAARAGYPVQQGQQQGQAQGQQQTQQAQSHSPYGSYGASAKDLDAASNRFF